LKTGNPAVVNSAFLLYFPFLFLTSSYVPRSQLSGWLNMLAIWNPVTYVPGGLRSIIMQGCRWEDLGQGLLAIAVVALVSMSMCFRALRGGLRQG
jgi:ABC-2 type transport system permease protein